MYNCACRNEPEAIVVIGDEKDAAEIVKFVRKAKYKINISVRSGGHSYSCTSSKVK